MNVFATLKIVFFGSKFLSGPVPSDGTPRRDLVSALNGLMPLCRTMPGVYLAVDIREGRVALVLDWTPRTDGNALADSYHYIVSDEDGVKEVSKSQVLLAENGEGNLLESRDGFSGCLAALTEETEEESVQLESVREVMNPIHSKDIKKEAQPISLENSRKEVGLKSSKDTEKEAAPISPEETVGKAKSRSLMQEVTTFLTSRYRFRFNVLTEETEVAGVENGISDDHLRYAKVDERWMNSLSLEAIEAGIDCWDRDIQRFVRSRRISEYHPFTAYFEQLPEWDGKDRVSALARRVSDNPVWVNGFHRWMLGLSAQWMQFRSDANNTNRANSINRANSVAPLLVSSRQGCKYSINSLVYWVTYVHNVVYSFYRSMIYCYINSTQRCAGSIVIDIIPTNGADKRKFFPFAPYFPVTNVIKRYFYPYFPAIIGIKGYSFPYFPYLSGIMKIKTALYSLFSRLDWHKTVVFPCLGEIYEGIRSLSWEIPVT